MKTNRLLVLSALCLAPTVLLAADEAQKPVPVKTGGSCRVADFVCADYDVSIAASAKASCTKYKLKWSDKACPTAGVAGTCVKQEGAGKSYTHTYPPGTAESAKTACDNTPGGKLVR